MQTSLITYYQRIPRLGKHILFWLTFITFFAVLYGSFDEDYGRQFRLQLIYLPNKLLATYITIYILLPRFLLTEQYLRFFSLTSLVLLVAGFMHWLTYYYGEAPIFWPEKDIGPLWYPNKILKSATYVYPVVVLATLIKFFKHWYQNQQATRQLAEDKLSAELKFLRSQIHPHFLFNTLNNLYALTLKKSEKAPEVVLKLSHLLNYMLYECNTDRVPLSKEIELLKNYVSLEKLRYGNRLDISLNISGNTRDHDIAPMLVLPFIENSFKHGVSDEIEDAWVSIDLTIKECLLTLKVDNSKSNQLSKDEQKYREGIGLKNVKRRLELLYKGGYELKTLDTVESYLIVLKMDMQSHKNVVKAD
ncbi:sensor histidine kinase [Fulvivirga sp. M361]|uniref:sensor histidine kinase n=1 Tax=Fulvivirga sp. M361 TaxID=2594266 RepID=UPI00117B1762|nr:histidine kinase [Fulvivirga sp. M361]TRX61317.1 sensor histidine kinase [Fulvivirga sp. M361]